MKPDNLGVTKSEIYQVFKRNAILPYIDCNLIIVQFMCDTFKINTFRSGNVFRYLKSNFHYGSESLLETGMNWLLF